MWVGRGRRIAWLGSIGLLGIVVSCASSAPSRSRPLSAQVDEAAQAFFDGVAVRGATAQSYFALFIPKDTVNRRHLLSFRETLSRALGRAAPSASMNLNASADRVFFLSRHRASGWTPPSGGEESGEVLARELRNGTSMGWTALHAFWGQYNRLLVGDTTWIQNLPESVRADLAHPLRYVVRATVRLTGNPNVVTYIHDLQLDLVTVGKEQTLYSTDFQLDLSYPLR